VSSRQVLPALLLLLCATTLSAQTFVFDLRGAQEVPPVPSTATGGCHGVLNQPAATFTLTCVHNVINATVAHIHRAPAGANGEIVFDLGTPTSPVTATWTGMTTDDIGDLLAGNLYLNIHTAGRPSGEIRGQIVPRSVDTVPFTASGVQTVPPNGTSATANCTANLDDAATALAIQCTHDVPAAIAAHVHEAPLGEVGPAIYTFPTPASPLNANVPLTPRQVADFAATFLYLDIHGPAGTEEEPGTEIRGQIGMPPAPPSSGTIQITKTTYPGGPASFDFNESITAGAFTLAHGGTRTFAGIAPGTYAVTELAEAGFTLGDVSCDDANSSGDTAARTATIRLEAGETVRCTFRNIETAASDQLFVFHLSGDQEVPPIATTNRGGCMGRFDAGASELTLVCTHDVDLPTLMHIHRGLPGVNGEIVFDLGEPTSPVIATWSGMTPADVADLLAGRFYVNIHTAGRPTGIIRGQIVTRTVDMLAFTAGANQVVPPGTSAATANCSADLSADATQLAVNCTHTLPAPDAAHIHDAPRGENGPAIFTFPSPASPLNANVPMTPRTVADFAAYFLYLDIHGAGGTEEAAPEQIRGQIGVAPVAVTTGTIRIVKATSPAGGGGFTFTDDVPGSAGAFALSDGGVQTFADVPAGTYTIAEALSGTHSVSDVSCGDADSTGNPFNRTATVRLQAGETVTCTFTNLQNATPTRTFVFHLSGSQEVPPNPSTARGGCFMQLDEATRTLSMVCTHNVTGPVLAHIHEAPAGSNGPIVFDLGNPVSPIEASWTMTPAEMATLLAGGYYINIHASGRPDGEIRGQLVPRTVDSFAFVANASQEVPPTGSTATGNCAADLSNDARSLFVQCSHNVPNVLMSHLHSAPPGVDGPVVFDYPNTSPFSGTTPLTPRLVADFAAGFLYVNIHAVDFEEGAIRGQLIASGPAPAEAATIPTLEWWGVMLMIAGIVAVGVRK
jgi:hypothetical protein